MNLRTVNSFQNIVDTLGTERGLKFAGKIMMKQPIPDRKSGDHMNNFYRSIEGFNSLTEF